MGTLSRSLILRLGVSRVATNVALLDERIKADGEQQKYLREREQQNTLLTGRLQSEHGIPNFGTTVGKL